MGKFKPVIFGQIHAAGDIESLWTVIGSCLKFFPPPECAAFLAHAGYGST
jgi:hypothetical protein